MPAALAERNSAITGIANRVEPDISMDADPTTGMLVGETQQFPEGTHYDEYRIGGTSLASPLFAGVMADADQANGSALGFVNPALYKLGASPSAASAYYDVVPSAPQALVRVDYLDGVDAEEGTITSVRTLEYEGKEEFCSGTGNCTQAEGRAEHRARLRLDDRAGHARQRTRRGSGKALTAAGRPTVRRAAIATRPLGAWARGSAAAQGARRSTSQRAPSPRR